MALRGDSSDWRARYDQSIRDEDIRIADAEAEESEWAKLINRAAYTGTTFDLVLLPFVLLLFGLPALYRHLRRAHR